MRKLGMIGFGAIGRGVVESWAMKPVEGFEFTALLVRSSQVQTAMEALAKRNFDPRPFVTDSIKAFCEAGCDLVVEAAGHGALRDCAPSLLKSGADLMIISTGVLADEITRAELRTLAEAHGRKILVPAGALAGFDGLAALRRAGLTSVLYRSSKPPIAWKETHAEKLIDLESVSEPVCFFRGNAQDAASLFPKNANLAAAVALAGIGFEMTQIELIADPALEGNVGRMIAISPVSSLDLTVSGAGMTNNPKTSTITAQSILAALDAQSQTMIFV